MALCGLSWVAWPGGPVLVVWISDGSKMAPRWGVQNKEVLGLPAAPRSGQPRFLAAGREMQGVFDERCGGLGSGLGFYDEKDETLADLLGQVGEMDFW